MWTLLLDRFLSRLIRIGSLRVTLPDGTARQYGPGDGSGPDIAIALHGADTPRRLVVRPELAVGEAYMDGRLAIRNDDLHGFLELVLRCLDDGGTLPTRIQRGWRDVTRREQQFNHARRARRNVAHHYDLSSQLYDLFLDEDRQYSCAYFKTPSDTLEQAQAQKKAHIARKLHLSPEAHPDAHAGPHAGPSRDLRVLDIGCGWGGMGLTLARDFGARVHGITLSHEQLAIARARAEAAGLSDRVSFELIDYRQVTGTFDRIVSVGMFEHVGVPQYRTYFRKIRELLTDDGVALLHTIGRMTPPGSTNPWIAKYIFPGGYIPALSETAAAIERESLWMTDVENWRLHYAYTLRHWHERFMARRDEAARLFDDRFVRMWRFYLVASEQVFRFSGECVYQIQLTRRPDAVPLTRDYLCNP